MASDAIVTPRHLLASLSRVRRMGGAEWMRQLEQREPELAEMVLEELSTIHAELMALGGPLRRTRRAYRAIELLLAVVLDASAEAHRQFWQPAADPPNAVTGPANADAGGQSETRI